MSSRLILLLLSGLWAPAVFGQPGKPPLKKEYLDSTLTVLPSAAGARFRRETEYVDSVRAEVRTYFLNGKLRSRDEFAHLRKGIHDGSSEWWFANGQLQSHATFKLGRRDGELRMYYENGQLKRRETYSLRDDFKTTGECFAPDGRPVPFFQFEQMPVYPEGDGGNRIIINAISRNLKFPRDARKAGKAGRVLVSFVVANTGEVEQIKLVQGVYPSIDEAVLSAVRQLKPFKPGMQDGQPVPVAFTVPISFRLE